MIFDKRQLATSSFLARYPVFTMQEAMSVLADDSGSSKNEQMKIKNMLGHLIESGVLKLIDRELYVVVQPSEDPRQLLVDPFLAAHSIRNDCIFAQHAALQLLGATHALCRRVKVFTSRRRRALQLSTSDVWFVTHPKVLRELGNVAFGTKTVEYAGKVLRVTGPERTLVEGFRNLAEVGGPEELVVSASSFHSLQVDLLKEVLECYNLRYLWSSVGWFLEKYQSTFHATDILLQNFAQRGLKVNQYLVRSNRGGTLEKRWHLVVPSSLMQLGER